MTQPTVREINKHLSSMTSYCVVYVSSFQMRISRARTVAGIKEGRVITYDSYSGRKSSSDWESIPSDANVELT